MNEVLDKMLDAADPYIVEGIMILLSTYFGWLFRWVFRTKQSQDSLHRALSTGVDLATDAVAGKVNLEEVISYVKGSVPDALKFLKPSDQQLRLMATAKAKAKFDSK